MDTTIPFLLGGVFLTSTLSGALGMGGGMLLMGGLVHLLPVPVAMTLHGLTQIASNGFRAGLLRDRIRLGVLLPYLAGALLALVLAKLVGRIPAPGTVLLVLGTLPFLAPLLPFRLRLSEEQPESSLGCGLTVGLLHLTAGVSGPVLDLFFLGSPLDRREVVATKAATQTLAHGTKLAYFALALEGGHPVLQPAFLLQVWLATLAGTLVGKRLLAGMSEETFRLAGTRMVRLAGIVYLLRGARLLWG